MNTTNKSVTENVTLGHSYDGIREYDNPLPGWWKWLFVLTVVVSPFYLLYFHVGGPNRSVHEQFAAALDANQKKKYADIGDLTPDAVTLVKYMKDPEWNEVGKSIYKMNCVSCHGAEGGGVIGPNLCDENYKHIKKVEDIVKVINEGVAGGAMPAWATRIPNKNDIVMVSAYVASLRGTSPANPKGPDGSPIAAWSAGDTPATGDAPATGTNPAAGDAPAASAAPTTTP
jgi:cytochrome c oxidase cbb3-type subunit 3